jgi:hypothetical protein
VRCETPASNPCSCLNEVHGAYTSTILGSISIDPANEVASLTSPFPKHAATIPSGCREHRPIYPELHQFRVGMRRPTMTLLLVPSQYSLPQNSLLIVITRWAGDGTICSSESRSSPKAWSITGTAPLSGCKWKDSPYDQSIAVLL